MLNLLKPKTGDLLDNLLDNLLETLGDPLETLGDPLDNLLETLGDLLDNLLDVLEDPVARGGGAFGETDFATWLIRDRGYS